MMQQRIDLVGQRFGRLTVTGYAGTDKRGEAVWDCICDCGSKSAVRGSHLRKGAVQSCGCYAKEATAERMRVTRTKGNTRHGCTDTRLYSTWTNMKTRCLNPNNRTYKWYGAVGVTICQEWMQFENFKEWALSSGYQEDLTIERVNPFGNYCPENCKWIPLVEQRRNQRRSKQWQD